MSTNTRLATTFLNDHETKVDLLNNEAVAATIVSVLRERPDRPVTIGVHGDWGAGKSSVLEMVEATLAEQQGVLCLKFNGWRFQGFEDAKIALIEGIVNGLIASRPILTKAAASVKDVFRRIDWLKVAKKAGGIALTASTGIPTPDHIAYIAAAVKGFLSDPTKVATKENFEALSDGISSFLKPESESKNVPEEIHEFRKAFDKLLEEAGIEQLVVLIDDLDRCLPETAIETLEAVRLFVFTSRTAFVVAADEAMIEYAVRKHFPDLPDSTGSQTYARNYLEKLIQVPFRIPALGETETRIYITLLLIGAEIGEGDSGFNKLITAARDRLRRPWEGGTLDAATIRAALGDKGTQALTALTLSDQIGPILASGTKGNPRQIKRFLNTLLLRQRTAEARGFGDDVNLAVLAKLMLAERFMSSLFDQIASAAAASPSGQCEDLALLESTVRDDTHTAPPDLEATGIVVKEGTVRSSQAKQQESTHVTEWLSSKVIRTWATVQPALAGVDLRPYLFVAKDRKDYFGAASVLGHLATIVEQLLGPKILVQGLDAELKRLAVPEAEQVFEAVRGRIIGAGSLDKEPAGVAGLAVLVQAQPKLQSHLLDFLEGLPLEHLGTWVVSGWHGVIRESEHVARFNRLLDGWAAQSKNKVLKTVAAAAVKTRKERR